jgi:heme/copper-type cytochrome/quinol oxidase subunit 3
MLALPPGGRDRPANVLSVATLLAGVAELMLVGALVAAYLNVRGLADHWPAKGVDLDNYLGTMLTVTIGLTLVTAEWSVYALRHGNRRQSLGALTITAGLGLAFLNLLWYLGTQLHFGPADHSYGTLAYALLISVGVIAVIGIAFLIAAAARTLGDQATSSDPSVVRAAAWHWHVVSVAWLLVFTALFLLQHR